MFIRIITNDHALIGHRQSACIACAAVHYKPPNYLFLLGSQDLCDPPRDHHTDTFVLCNGINNRPCTAESEHWTK